MNNRPSVAPDPPVTVDPPAMIRPRRTILGMSAILLPFHENHDVAWDDFDKHVVRTLDAGLVPAINMDTGYANLIDDATRITALQRTQSIASGRQFVAGVYVPDSVGEPFNENAYHAATDQVQQHDGTPILFQSFGLTGGDDESILQRYQTIAAKCDDFLAFELGTMFAPFGKIYSLALYEQLMRISNCRGAKHSSLCRELEWQRLALRDRVRPDFRVLTGNDLAIDMVMYGSDYLLGLSTFSPAAFAKRDALWAAGDPAFYELNDLLQYLGTFAFRDPVPAYKHSAAQFLHLQGLIGTSKTHLNSPSRPESDLAILRLIAEQIQIADQLPTEQG